MTVEGIAENSDPVECTPWCPDPTSALDDNIEFNSDLSDNIDFGVDAKARNTITITGTVAPRNATDAASLAPSKVVKSMNRLSGKVKIDEDVFILSTKLTVSSEAASADWVYRVGSKNSSIRGGSGSSNPISFNPGSFWTKTGAHELLHIFGVGHSLNSTKRISSYRLKSDGRGKIADYRRVKPDDVKALLRYKL